MCLCLIRIKKMQFSVHVISAGLADVLLVLADIRSLCLCLIRIKKMQFSVHVISAGLADVLLVLADIRSLCLFCCGQFCPVIWGHWHHMAVSFRFTYFAQWISTICISIMTVSELVL